MTLSFHIFGLAVKFILFHELIENLNDNLDAMIPMTSHVELQTESQRSPAVAKLNPL